jgi:hypothetical protein
MVGGKETGASMSHYILPDGPFFTAYAKLQTTGFELHWQSTPETPQAKIKRESKTKYQCPGCGLNAWAKPDAPLACADCDVPMIAQKKGSNDDD